MSDVDLATQVENLLKETTVSYPAWQKNVEAGKYNPKNGSGTAWGQAFAILAQIGVNPPPPPPPTGWVAALPGSTGNTVTSINHPTGAGVNIYNSSQPMVIADTVVVGGADQSFLVQPGAPGRTFQRIQSVLAVEDGQSVSGNNKHGFYVKAANTTVLDYTATASTQGDGGLSVRYSGFLGQRVTLDNFQLPLCIFADDETAGQVVFRQIKITNPRNTPCYFDVDEAAKMVYNVVIDQVDVTGWSGNVFCSVNPSTFAGTVTITNCTMNGKPVTAANVQNVPSSKLKVS